MKLIHPIVDHIKHQARIRKKNAAPDVSRSLTSFKNEVVDEMFEEFKSWNEFQQALPDIVNRVGTERYVGYDAVSNYGEVANDFTPLYELLGYSYDTVDTILNFGLDGDAEPVDADEAMWPSVLPDDHEAMIDSYRWEAEQKARKLFDPVFFPHEKVKSFRWDGDEVDGLVAVLENHVVDGTREFPVMINDAGDPVLDIPELEIIKETADKVVKNLETSDPQEIEVAIAALEKLRQDKVKELKRSVRGSTYTVDDHGYIDTEYGKVSPKTYKAIDEQISKAEDEYHKNHSPESPEEAFADDVFEF